MFNLEHPEGPPAEVIEVEESGNDDSEDEDEIQTSNKSGIEELKKLTLIVAYSRYINAAKNTPAIITNILNNFFIRNPIKKPISPPKPMLRVG